MDRSVAVAACHVDLVYRCLEGVEQGGQSRRSSEYEVRRTLQEPGLVQGFPPGAVELIADDQVHPALQQQSGRRNDHLGLASR